MKNFLVKILKKIKRKYLLPQKKLNESHKSKAKRFLLQGKSSESFIFYFKGKKSYYFSYFLSFRKLIFFKGKKKYENVLSLKFSLKVIHERIEPHPLYFLGLFQIYFCPHEEENIE